MTSRLRGRVVSRAQTKKSLIGSWHQYVTSGLRETSHLQARGYQTPMHEHKISEMLGREKARKRIRLTEHQISNNIVVINIVINFTHIRLIIFINFISDNFISDAIGIVNSISSKYAFFNSLLIASTCSLSLFSKFQYQTARYSPAHL